MSRPVPRWWQRRRRERTVDACAECLHPITWHRCVSPAARQDIKGGFMVCPRCPCSAPWGNARQDGLAVDPWLVAHARTMCFGIQ